MNCDILKIPNSPRRTLGFTLVEAVISIVLVGLLLVAAINTLGASALSKRNIEHQALGYPLAQDLMTEILIQAYEEPVDAINFGRESGEGGGSRANWDDVDDYDGWSARPPKAKDGVTLYGYDQWTRSVVVAFVKPTSLNNISADTGVKRITVMVAHNTTPVAELVAIRTVAWPIDKINDSLKVLLVVTDDSNPSDQALSRQALMELWGFKVTLIKATDSQSNFDTAVANADMAYVSEEIRQQDLGTKLQGVLIGVINEDIELYKVFGFSDLFLVLNSQTDIAIVDITQYITSPFTLGALTIFSSSQDLMTISGTMAPDLQVLAESTDGSLKPALTVLKTGAQGWKGGFVAGRRVQLPWGNDPFDINLLTADGQTVMKRAIEWAANKEQP